jgi:hypothetical protein
MNIKSKNSNLDQLNNELKYKISSNEKVKISKNKIFSILNKDNTKT